jgi:transposase
VATDGTAEQLDRRDARVAELEAALTGSQARVAELEANLEVRNAAFAELEAVVVKLTAQLEELTEKLNRNSSNSHLPPSSDGPGSSTGRKKPKAKSKRKRGGQKGHRGAHRALAPVEHVDEFVQMYPEGCEGCGATLPPTPDADARRHQQLELLAGRRHLTEYRRHQVACPRCGHRTRAAYDPAKIPSSPFGPQLTTLATMLTGAYHLSRRSAQRVLQELSGIELSLGALSAMEARASAALKAAFDEAERAAQDADVKHADGTSWLRAGVSKSLWTLATATVVVYRIFANGQRKTIRAMFGALKGILVSDRATVFHFWGMKFRQICHAHLLRKFISFSERDGPAGAFGRELLGYTVLVFEYWHAFKNGKLTRDELVTWMRPVQRQYEATLRRAVAANIARLSGSCADILAHRQALWTFVVHDGVEPTNNDAERALRPFVLWRHRSSGCQSERGERFAERMMTVVQTLRRQRRDVLDFLVRSVTAHVTGTLPPALHAA